MPADLEIDTATGEAAFFGARTPAWHRLGTIAAEAQTSAEALRLAHLDGWQVEKMPLVTAAHDGTPMPVEGRYATVRRNPFDHTKSDVLGVGLTDDYTCFQNEQVAEWTDTLVDVAGAAVYETAGSLAGGRKVFLTLGLPEGLRVGGVDAYDLYLAAITSHDGSMALTTITTPTRIVCANTLGVALAGAQVSHKIRHTSTMEGRVAEARETLSISLAYADAFTAAMEALLDREMTNAQFDALVKREFVSVPDDAPKATLARAAESRAELTALFRSADTQDFGRGTRYAALNALTEWSEWVRPATPATEAATASTLFGAGREARQRAFALLSK